MDGLDASALFTLLALDPVRLWPRPSVPPQPGLWKRHPDTVDGGDVEEVGGVDERPGIEGSEGMASEGRDGMGIAGIEGIVGMVGMAGIEGEER